LRALTLAATLIQSAAQTKHRDVAPRLAGLVTERLSLLTDDRYTEVNIDTERFAVSLLCPERPDMVPLEMASHGTRDQVSLLLRIALCDVLGSGREAIPLLFDEPLLTSDPVRRDCMIEFLHELSVTNQVVVSTSDPAVAAAARRVCGDACSIVAMEDPSAATRVARRAVHVVS
jgi:uncharacterized protein YhaN